jgi:mycoredoxin
MGLGGGRLRTAYPVRVVKAWAIPLTYAVMAAGQIFFALRMDGAARFAAAGCAVVLLAGAFYFRPRALPRSTYDEATRAADEGRVVIYHRPGCVFCARLASALGRAGRDRAVWVDIWGDPQAAAYVRSVNDGNETVPTVVIDGAAVTNPPPARVRAALGL